jgi:hypothetical protein
LASASEIGFELLISMQEFTAISHTATSTRVTGNTPKKGNEAKLLRIRAENVDTPM